ncbi:glycosyltransferase [Aeromonas veronii]|uniref:glycosyltransferase n=1 Tax=Aeromonas TaxID=642 RepID=UPI002253BA9D|nr:glycosyltransferase [Aeromonas veronii]MCX4044472.1 glycosyltransferase [Aeromonas veronii]
MMTDSQLKCAVVFFAFNRPDKLQGTIESYLCCKNRKLDDVFVFIDGPRNNSDVDKVNQCAQIANVKLPYAQIIIRETNFGLKKSIYGGISQILSEYDAIIVIEDDLRLSPDFYDYMVASLEEYKNSENVMQISGYNYLGNEFLDRNKSAFFLPITTSWGWGTWSRAWQSFSINNEILLQDLDKKKFNFFSSFPFFTMLEKELTGQVSSWAIRWYHHVFQSGGLVLYPPATLVDNEGFDSTGTHSAAKSNVLYKKVIFEDLGIVNFPQSIEIDRVQQRKLVGFFKKKRLSIISKHVVNLIARALNRVRNN